VCHAPQQHGHAPSSRLIVRNLTPGVALDKKLNLLGREFATISLFDDDVYSTHHHASQLEYERRQQIAEPWS
jgi:hypothetical protein